MVGVGVGAWCRASLLLRGQAGATATGITRTHALPLAAAAAILSLLTDGQARNTTGHSTGGWLVGLLESCGVHMAACAGSVPPAVPVPRARACFWSGVVGVCSKSFVNQTTSGPEARGCALGVFSW